MIVLVVNSIVARRATLVDFFCPADAVYKDKTHHWLPKPSFV